LSSAYGGWVLVVFLLVSYFFSYSFALYPLCERRNGESEEEEGICERDEEMTYFEIPKERIYEEVDDYKRRKE